MSANRLREAARVLRERAEAATPGPWYPNVGGGYLFGRDVGDEIGRVRPNDAKYIATVSPDFGLAVADWLDAEAQCSDEADAYTLAHADEIRVDFTSRHEALAVADTILGGDA